MMDYIHATSINSPEQYRMNKKCLKTVFHKGKGNSIISHDRNIKQEFKLNT